MTLSHSSLLLLGVDYDNDVFEKTAFFALTIQKTTWSRNRVTAEDLKAHIIREFEVAPAEFFASIQAEMPSKYGLREKENG